VGDFTRRLVNLDFIIEEIEGVGFRGEFISIHHLPSYW